MTTALKPLIECFEPLSEQEQQEAAIEILRRIVPEGKLPGALASGEQKRDLFCSHL